MMLEQVDVHMQKNEYRQAFHPSQKLTQRLKYKTQNSKNPIR